MIELPRHEPQELVGKSIVINEREYVVGQLFRQSDQGYSYFLINTMSGLMHLIAQFRLGYRLNPQDALHAAQTKQNMNAKLRWHFKQENPTSDTPVVSCVEAAGGAFELHEVGYIPYPHAPGFGLLQQATALSKERKYAQALALAEQVLVEHPNHTQAMLEAAGCHEALNQLPRALPLLRKAIQVEPNYSQYRLILLNAMLHCEEPRQALNVFNELYVSKPHVFEAHIPGIYAALDCGEPDCAQQVLEHTVVRGGSIDELRQRVAQAFADRQRARDHNDAWRAQGQSMELASKPYLTHLESMTKLYPCDPIVLANFGFALRAQGQFQDARVVLMASAIRIDQRFLPWCHVNAAFCSAQQGAWDDAYRLLVPVAQALFAESNRPAAKDLPGLADWIGPVVVAESHACLAAELTDQVIAQCSAAHDIPQALRDMAALYRGAARLVVDADALR